MKLKICGMKHNIGEVAALRPDYLGFILWEKSARYLTGALPNIPKGIKKTGVFVNAEVEAVLKRTTTMGLHAVQLHGGEPPEYCSEIRKRAHTGAHKPIEVIKVFSIKDTFDFSILENYESTCDFYLFDTKGELPGGNGYGFDWRILKDYPSTKPYFLSGGIGLESVDGLTSFLRKKEARYCYALDINSRFEVRPGEKDLEKLKEFKALLQL